MAQEKNREQGREAGRSLSRVGGEMTPASQGPGTWSRSPFRGVFEDMERMLESMQRSFFGGMMGFGGRWIPALDVRDAGQEIVIEAELPGIDPKDVQVECRGDVLVIRGQGEQRREDERAVVRRSGSFLRQIPIPPGVDLERARASSRHGMLTIRLPKTADAREPVKRIPISIESARDTRDKVA